MSPVDKYIDIMNNTIIDLIKLKAIEEDGFEPKHLGHDKNIADAARKYFKHCCEILEIEEFKTRFTEEEAELLRFNGMIVNDNCIIKNECLLEKKAHKNEPVSLQERYEQVNIIHNTGMVNKRLGEIINNEMEKERKDNWSKK